MKRIFFCGECRKFFFEECDESVYASKCSHCESQLTVTCDLDKDQYDTYSDFKKSTFKETIKKKYPDVESIVMLHQKIAAQKEQEIARAKRNQEIDQIMVTSGSTFEGYRIVKYSDYILGNAETSVSRGSAWEGVSIRESVSYIRRKVIRELKETAYSLGCNAVVGVDFDYVTLAPETANASGGTTYQPYVCCVTANGNAVIIEKIED